MKKRQYHLTRLPRGLTLLGMSVLLSLSLSQCTPRPSGGTGHGIKAAAIVEPGEWSEGEKESESNFECDANQVISARKHNGDENGKTYYKCAKVKQFEYITLTEKVRSDAIKESDGTRYVCPDGKVMTGRSHSGDENGSTRYYCSDPIDKWKEKMNIVPGTWSDGVKEAGSDYSCPANQVMIGRYHTGDENGKTEYLCGTLW